MLLRAGMQRDRGLMLKGVFMNVQALKRSSGPGKAGGKGPHKLGQPSLHGNTKNALWASGQCSRFPVLQHRVY